MNASHLIEITRKLAPTLLPLLLLPLTQLLAEWSKGQVVRALGWWGVPLTTGWLGVPLHEASHVVAAKLLGRTVVRVRWFAPDADTGTLGAVEWQPGTGPLAWLAVLAVGVAPLVAGTLALRGLLQLVAYTMDLPLPSAPLATDLHGWLAATLALGRWALTLTHTVWMRHDALAWLAPLGWWTVASVAAHLTPSRADLRGVWRGVLLLAVPATLTVGLLASVLALLNPHRRP